MYYKAVSAFLSTISRVHNMGEGALNRGLDMDVDRFIRVDNRWSDKSFLFLIVENNRWRSCEEFCG